MVRLSLLEIDLSDRRVTQAFDLLDVTNTEGWRVADL